MRMNLSEYCVCFIWMFVSLFNKAVTSQTPQTYCSRDPFEAVCGEEQMILIEEGRYGRMFNNDCIAKNYGYIGCGQDVSIILSKECSGKVRCSVQNLEAAFGASRGDCPSDLKAFLQASYTCENVTVGSPDACAELGYIPVSDKEGFLASRLSQQFRYGTETYCPWFLTAPPGQHYVFTLYNFVGEPELPDTGPTGREYCRAYALITEEDGTEKTIIACPRVNEANQVLQVYVSKGHQVTVRLSVHAGGPPMNFALHYKVHGCALPVLPQASHISLKTDTSIQIRCNYSSESWRLQCGDDGNWQGTPGNCSGAAGIIRTTDDTAEIPYGVAIAIIVGVALLICCLIFLCGIIFLRRREFLGRRNRRMRLDSAGYSAVDGTEMKQMKRSGSARFTTNSLPPTPCKRRPPPGHVVQCSPMLRTQSLGRGSRGDYAHIWEIRRPIPVSTPKVPGHERSAPDGTSPCVKTKTLDRDVPQQIRLPLSKGDDFPPPPATFNTFKPLGDHVYESPRFAQFHRSAAGRSVTPGSPMYFQVDGAGTVPRGMEKPIPPRRSLDQCDKNRLRTMGMSGGSVRREPDSSESEEGKITV